MKVSIKVQRIVGTLSIMRSIMSITFKCIFSGEYHICNIYTNIQKYHISMYFLGKLSFIFHSRKNITFSGKKIPSFQLIQER